MTDCRLVRNLSQKYKISWMSEQYLRHLRVFINLYTHTHTHEIHAHIHGYMTTHRHTQRYIHVNKTIYNRILVSQ